MLIINQVEKLRDYHRQYGYLPTYEELQKILGYRSKSSGYYLVNKMVRYGYLRRKNHKIVPGKNFLGMPYYKSVRAGFPGPAEEEANDRLSLDRFLVDKPNSTILIRVKGDSMNGAGILEGDIVVVERTSAARSGDIVVVNLEGEFTVKTLRRKNGTTYLEAANPHYPILDLSSFERHELVGIVRGSVRRYGMQSV
jgi:repressor LexA